MPKTFAKKTGLILGACLLAAGAAFASADPFQAALQSASLKAKNAFISGQPIYGALGANPTAALVQALNAPRDQDSNAAPRRLELAAFSATLQNVNTIQTMAAGDGRNPQKIQALISAAAVQWRLTPSEAERCRELYLGDASGKSGNSSGQTASAAVSAAQAQAAAEQRAGLQKTGAAAMASVQGQIAGWQSPEAQNIPRAPAGTTAATAFSRRGRTAGTILPEAGPQTLSIPPVPSPSQARQIKDARAVQAAAEAYRENGGAVSNSLAYWRARENPDIRSGESALGYTARITSAKVMAGLLSLSGLASFEKSVAQYGYLSATDASAGTKAKAAAAAAGHAALTFVSLGGADGVLGPAFKAGGKLLSKIPQLARVAEASPEAMDLLYGDVSAADHENFAGVVERSPDVQKMLDRIKELPISMEQKQTLVRRLIETKITPTYEGADELVGRQTDRLMREVPAASAEGTAHLPQQAEAQMMEGRLAQARPGAAPQIGADIYRSSKYNSLESLGNSLHSQVAREGDEGADYIATKGSQATAKQTGPFCAEHALCNLFDSHVQNGEIDKVADIESKILETKPEFRKTGGLSKEQIYSVASSLAQKVGKTAEEIEPENMVSFMKETGEPVLVTVRSSEDGGHAMLVGKPFRAGDGKIIFETFDSNNPTGAAGYISAFDLGRIITGAIAVK